MPNSSDPRISKIEQRLKALKEKRRRKKSAAPGMEEARAMSQAWRFVLEFTVPIVVGILLGQWIDKSWDSMPWGTLIFLLLGLGAGIMNMARLAKASDAEQQTETDGKPARPVQDQADP